jgi:hypothetical protein
MRRLPFLLFPLLLACSLSGGLIADPTPTPLPTATPRATPTLTCKGRTCIRNIYVYLDSENMYVQLDLADLDGQVIFAKEPRVNGALTFELFLLVKTYAENQEIYLYGASLPPSDYLSYVGNDLPWSFGVLGSVSTLKIPIARMQVRPVTGDRVRVQIKEFDRSEELIVAPMSVAFAYRLDSPYLATVQSLDQEVTPEAIATEATPGAEELVPTEAPPPTVFPPPTGAFQETPTLTPPVQPSPTASRSFVTPLFQPSPSPSPTPSPTSGTAYPLVTPTLSTVTAYP